MFHLTGSISLFNVLCLIYEFLIIIPNKWWNHRTSIESENSLFKTEFELRR